MLLAEVAPAFVSYLDSELCLQEPPNLLHSSPVIPATSLQQSSDRRHDNTTPLTASLCHTGNTCHKVSLGGVIESAITGLTPEEQMELVKGISKHLYNQGVIPEGVSSRYV